MSPTRLSLRTAARSRQLTFTLKSQERLSRIRATLRRGRVLIGRGGLATLQPSRDKLAVKLARKLRRGSYTLVVRARRSDASTASADFKLRAR